MKKFINKLKKFAPILIVAVILMFSLRGLMGVPTSEEVSDPDWKQDGPFELSPERGRFALTYSLIEDSSFSFSIPLARFVAPDLGYQDGEYVSLFAPAVSFLIMPGYLIGRALGASQVGAFAAVSLFALVNFILIREISKLLGAKPQAATLAGIIFLFGTPAYAYAVNLYQHHISTFLILGSIYLVIKYGRKWITLFLVMFLCALGLSVDNPNLFMMFPIGIFSLLSWFDVSETQTKLKIKIHLKYIFTVAGVILPILFFLAFNYLSYGDPFQLAGTVPSVAAVDESGLPTLPDNLQDDPEVIKELLNPEEQEKSSVGFFKTRNIINGFYIHFLSPDRGIFYFTPVMFLGFIGGYMLYKQNNKYLVLLASVSAANVILYSMWGDPWGGWGFGSRYLIPSYAIMSIFISIFLSNFPKRRIVRWFVRGLIIYSLAVNTLGAITTSAMPPKVQADALGQISGRHERYTYLRNWDYINDGGAKAFVFKEFLSDKLDAREYYFILLAVITVFSMYFFRVVYPIKAKK